MWHVYTCHVEDTASGVIKKSLIVRMISHKFKAKKHTLDILTEFIMRIQQSDV